MRGLWFKVVVALAVSLVASVTLAHLAIRARTAELLEGLRNLTLASGLGALHRELTEAPGHEDTVVTRWQSRVDQPLVWAPLPEGAVPEPWAEWRGGWSTAFDVHLPVAGRQLVIGPYTPPQPSTTTLLLATGGVVLSVLAGAAMVAVPLGRRLAQVDRALSSLEAGDLSVRVSDSGSDIVGHLASGFNHMAGALERRVREREELLQAVAHEYGTPLARLAVRVELLAKRLPPEHADRVEGLRAEIASLDGLTSELVEWVALDGPSGDGTILEPVAVIRAAVTEEMDGSATAVETELPDRLPALRGEPRDLERAVANVVRNALRHARHRVRVSARHEGDTVWVQVDDDGPGIPEEERDRVVEPFVRLEASRDRRTGGAGLGLAITKRCVERCGGTLAIEGHSPMGTRVVLRLPLRTDRT